MNRRSGKMAKPAGFLVRWRDRLAPVFRSHLWFPHVPLFGAALVLGVVALNPLLDHMAQGSLSLGGLIELSGTVFDSIMQGAPRVIAGVFLVAMSAGLLLRSRLAWIIVTFVTGASFVIGVAPGPRHSTDLAIFAIVLLAGLILERKHFQKSSIATASLFATTSILSLLAYAVIGTYALGNQFSPPVKDLSTALYFAVVSMSTVGYGDILPRTPEAHLFVVSIIILGITVFATSLSTFVVPLVGRRMQSLLRTRGMFMGNTDHYVIVSRSALARNSSKELMARGHKVVFILDAEPDQDDEEVEYIVGDASDLAVLRRANGDTAKGILALSDDDSANAFVVLAAKELGGTAKTVTVVNDTRNLERIKWVHPDVIIAPTVLGGELLAMALSGEEVQGDKLLERLLQFGG